MRIEYHRTLLADRVRNAAFHAALQHAHRQGRDHRCRHRCRHRLPRLPGGKARRQAGRSLRGGRDRRRGAQAPAPQPARRLPHRRGAFDRGGLARPRRRRRVRDARQLSLRGKHHRHAQRRAGAVPQARRRDHPARRRAVRRARRRRALLARSRRLGRGRIRPRLRAGQGHEPQQHLRALVRGSRSARWRQHGCGWDEVAFDRRNKTTRTGEAAWRLRRPDHDLWPGAVVARGAGAGGHALDRAARTRARTGSSSICRRCRRSRCRPARPLPPTCAPPPPTSAAPT